MKDICTINLNEGEGRQTISWNEEDKLLYTDFDNSPVDGYRYNTFDDAVNACYAMWGCDGMIIDSWELEWIEE